MKKERKKFKKLMRTNSKEECLAVNEEVGFDYPAFIKLNSSLNEFTVVKAVEDFRGMKKEAKKAGRELFFLNDLKNKWELKGMTSFNELKEALIDENVANIIIVSHGQSNGKLVDSRFNELPHNVLNWMNPNLLSVSFFSCHSKQAIINYGFEEKLRSQQSFHPVRYAGSVNTSSLLEENNQAPTKALSQFIVSVDQDIALALEGTKNAQVLGRNHLPSMVPEKVCTLEVDKVEVEKGAFSVKLNSNWIGTLYPEMKVNSFKYPCSWLKAEDNSVFFEGSSLIEKSSIKAADFEVVAESVRTAPTKITRREDGSISTVRFKFNKHSANE